MRYKIDFKIQDCAFLGLVTFLSMILYIGRIGFYSDDWSFLGTFATTKDQSFPSLFWSLVSPNEFMWMRPTLWSYRTVLYCMFGSDPFGYHVTNSFFFIVGILLFYLVLLELHQPRVIALATALVYSLLPHYSTDRFWVYAANLSMAFYFISLYIDLRTYRTQGVKFGIWRFVSLISMIVSALTYELFVPLLLLNPFLIYYSDKHSQPSTSVLSIKTPKFWFMFGGNALIIAILLLFKGLITTRFVSFELGPDAAWFVRLFSGAFSISYGKYGIFVPFVLYTILKKYLHWQMVGLGAMVSFLIFFYLHRSNSFQSNFSAQKMRSLVFVGLFVFFISYMIFLNNRSGGNTATGINNRIAIAATIGTALSWIGAIGWISARAATSSRLARKLFCGGIALLCGINFLIINTIGNFWVRANEQQQRIISDIRSEFPKLPPGSTLILDGACPYLGPAPVFECAWDVAGLLQFLYRDSTLLGDAVKPRLRITKDGLRTSIYGDESLYPYHNLFIYNFDRKIHFPVTNEEAARRYFETYDPFFGIECPESEEGFGVPVF